MAPTSSSLGMVLSKYPATPAESGGPHVVLIVVGTQDQYDRPWIVSGQPTGEIDSVDSREPDVHEDDVGPGVGNDLEGSFTVSRLADHGKPCRVLENAPGPCPQEFMIVHDDDPAGPDDVVRSAEFELLRR